MSSWLEPALYLENGAMIPQNSGAVKAYALTRNDAYNLVVALTSPSFLDSAKILFSDISGTINSLYCFPFPLPISGEKRKLNILLHEVKSYGDNVGAYQIDPIHYQYQKLLLYPILIKPKGDVPHYYDYNGYTKIFVYLPYYGEVEVMANDVMNKYLQVTWAMSPVSGRIMYFILVSAGPNPINPPYEPVDDIRLIGKYEVDIAVEVPIGSTNVHAVNRNIIMSAANAVTTVATAGISIGLSASGVGMSSASSTVSSTTQQRSRGSARGARLRTVEESSQTTNINTSRNVPISRQVLGAAEAVANTTLSALNNSVVRGSSEITKNPILEQFASHSVKVTIYRPKIIETYHSRYVGLPLNQIGRINAYEGFTKVSQVHLENFPAHITMEELSEIENILTTGYIN